MTTDNPYKTPVQEPQPTKKPLLTSHEIVTLEILTIATLVILLIATLLKP